MKNWLFALLIAFPLASFAGEWIADLETGCQVWNPGPVPGETIKWSGACQNVKATGKGTLQWFLDGKPNGLDECEYRDGKKHGRGISTLTNGERYEGEWQDDKRNGKGTATFANGARYEGEWQDNNWVGRGILTYADGSRYEGDWLEGKRSGRGILTYADGSRYEGDWLDNKTTGRGVWKLPNASQNNQLTGTTFDFDIDTREPQNLGLIKSMPNFQTDSDFVAVIKMKILPPYSPVGSGDEGIFGFVVDNSKVLEKSWNNEPFKFHLHDRGNRFYDGLSNIVAVSPSWSSTQDMRDSENRMSCEGWNGPTQSQTDVQPSFYCGNIYITLWKRNQAVQISYFDHRTEGVHVDKSLRPDSIRLIAHRIHAKGNVEFVFPGNPGYPSLEAALIQRWDKKYKVSLENILFGAIAAYGTAAIVGAADCLVGGNKLGSCGGSKSASSSDSKDKIAPPKDGNKTAETTKTSPKKSGHGGVAYFKFLEVQKNVHRDSTYAFRCTDGHEPGRILCKSERECRLPDILGGVYVKKSARELADEVCL